MVDAETKLNSKMESVESKTSTEIKSKMNIADFCDTLKLREYHKWVALKMFKGEEKYTVEDWKAKFKETQIIDNFDNEKNYQNEDNMRTVIRKKLEEVNKKVENKN